MLVRVSRGSPSAARYDVSFVNYVTVCYGCPWSVVQALNGMMQLAGRVMELLPRLQARRFATSGERLDCSFFALF